MQRPVIRLTLLSFCDQRTRRIAIFALPIVTFYLISGVLTIFPWYSGPFMALGLFYGMHHVCFVFSPVSSARRTDDPLGPWTLPPKVITRVVLEFDGAGDGLAKSPYFASVITMSIFYVAQCWFSRVVRASPLPQHSPVTLLLTARLSAFRQTRQGTRYST